ncbi:MAG: cytochrome b N-terminal domain-containing protein, partial [Caulobacterales bacterium]|nr:cytochrome b N-terminal domain-containing protein [Caulobacterales bacterium]
GANVITSLLGALPWLGPPIQTWLQGAPAIGDPTLNRFFSLHYLLPFVIFGVVMLHVWALHVPGNNNPTGVSVKSKADTVPFHPYYTVKDGFALTLFVILFAVFVFFLPDALGHADNFIPADPLQTPAHIVPEWYLLPFYAILRAVPDKLSGVLLMFGSIGVLFILPWLDTSKVRSMRYRPLARQFFIIFAINAVFLGWLGGQTPEGWKIIAARLSTAYYFAYFVIILPLLGVVETPKPRPASIDAAVLGKSGRDQAYGGAPQAAE